jgi:hypothetical protein
VARVVREELRVVEAELRDELSQQSRRRTVRLYSGATASALYGGGALAIAVGLLLDLVMPAWGAFLIVAAAMFAAAVAMRSAARERHSTGDAARTAAGEPRDTAVPADSRPPRPPADPHTPHHRD